MSKEQLNREIEKITRERKQLKHARAVRLPTVKAKSVPKSSTALAKPNSYINSPFLHPKFKSPSKASTIQHEIGAVSVDFSDLSLEIGKKASIVCPDFDEGAEAKAEAEALDRQVHDCLDEVEILLAAFSKPDQNYFPDLRRSKSAPASLVELNELQQHADMLKNQMFQGEIANHQELEELLHAADGVQHAVQEEVHSRLMAENLARRQKLEERRKVRRQEKREERKLQREKARERRAGLKKLKTLYNKFYQTHIVEVQRMRRMEEEERVKLEKHKKLQGQMKREQILIQFREKNGISEEVNASKGQASEDNEEAKRRVREMQEKTRLRAEADARALRKLEADKLLAKQRAAREVERKKVLKEKQKCFRREKKGMVAALADMQVKKETVLPRLQCHLNGKSRTERTGCNPLAGATVGLQLGYNGAATKGGFKGGRTAAYTRKENTSCKFFTSSKSRLGARPTQAESSANQNVMSFKAVLLLMPPETHRNKGGKADPDAAKIRYTKLQKWAVLVIYKFVRTVQTLVRAHTN